MNEKLISYKAAKWHWLFSSLIAWIILPLVSVIIISNHDVPDAFKSLLLGKDYAMLAIPLLFIVTFITLLFRRAFALIIAVPLYTLLMLFVGLVLSLEPILLFLNIVTVLWWYYASFCLVIAIFELSESINPN